MATAQESSPGRLKRAGLWLWRWTPFYRNANRPSDTPFVALWNIPRDDVSIRQALRESLPEKAVVDDVAIGEDSIRKLVQQYFPVPEVSYQEVLAIQTGPDSAAKLEELEGKREKLRFQAEESWPHVPERLRNILAALNSDHLEAKLANVQQQDYHTGRGIAAAVRAQQGISKVFRMWRLGFKAGVSLTERVLIQLFFGFLMFLLVFPSVAAGFLGENVYNVRQTGSRVFTLIQITYLYLFDYSILWLLFNWSLERLIGALVGNIAYGLAAAVPAVGRVYHVGWFRILNIVLSTTWQIGIQFGFIVRDVIERLISRRQINFKRSRSPQSDWATFDNIVAHELTTLKTFQTRRLNLADPAALPELEVPLRVRVERYIQFTNSWTLGRNLDMLIGLQKDDLENLLNVFEDYASSAPKHVQAEKKDNAGHTEAQLPKWLFVAFDVAIFAFVSYSFFHQPFTFQTVVAYGAVVIVKQSIIASKKYQTIKSAQRLFTNMTAFNIWGIFLVSVPVVVNESVFQNTGAWVGLMIAMVIATTFLTEPMAPLFQWVGEGVVRAAQMVHKRFGGSKKVGSADPDEQRTDSVPTHLDEKALEVGGDQTDSASNEYHVPRAGKD